MTSSARAIEVLHGVEVTGFTQNEHGVVAGATDKAGGNHRFSASISHRGRRGT